jgi:pSer/pThr/pTyr-binding forkhead associated (FHA) protein
VANDPSATALGEKPAETSAATSKALLLEPDAANPLAGQRFPLDQPLVTLGRRESNTIVVPEQAVSRAHAEIRREDSAFVLRDLGSTSGTYLNGAPLAGEQRLRPGDVVGLGPDVTFIVREAALRE